MDCRNEKVEVCLGVLASGDRCHSVRCPIGRIVAAIPLSKPTPAVRSIGKPTSADLFCQLDDDALGAADVAEPVAVLVAHQLADELGAAGL